MFVESYVGSCNVCFFMFFFFKQKTAYEMLRSLVGSEMCIRDRGPGPVAPCCIEAPSEGLCNRYPRLSCTWLLRMAALAGPGVDGEWLIGGVG